MATTTMTATFIKKESITKRFIMGGIFALAALIVFLVFMPNTQPGATTSFVMTPGGITQGVVGDWVVNSRNACLIAGVLIALIAIYQLIRSFKRWTNAMLGVVALLFIFSFLVYAATGRSINLGGLIASSISLAVPIVFGAFSGILCERAGVVNIAIEGMMLMGAMVGALVGSVTQNAWAGLLASILASTLLAWVHAVLSIKYRINQIISGTVINIFATGMTSFISSKFLQVYQHLNSSPIFTRIPIPGLSDIPFIGPIFFNSNLYNYLMFILLIVLQIALFSTKWGLRVRSVGEHPKAADTLGINVFRTRYMAVLLGGVMAGIGGAYFTLGSVGRFDEMMTAGKGYIGLAAMIFGNWSPIGSFGAGLLFGFADTLGSKLSILGSVIPPEFMAMLPYIVTMIILAGLIGKGQMPAADGTPYEKE